MASRNLDKILLFSTDFVDFIIAASQILVAKGFAKKYFTGRVIKAWIQAPFLNLLFWLGRFSRYRCRPSSHIPAALQVS